MTNRIYAQYADKPKAVAWYNITPNVSQQLFDTFDAVRMSYDIEAAVGAQLDVIGRIVVIDRGFESFVVSEADCRFGAGNKASRFGGSSARFNSRGGILQQEISDAVFRMLIRAKIAKNNNDATLDGVVSALRYITNSSSVRVIDNEDMTMSVAFGTTLSEIDRFVFNTFDVIPRPQGVEFLGYTETPTITRFGGVRRWGNQQARFKEFIGV